MIENYTVIKTSPILISENKAGLEKYWQVQIVKDGEDKYYTRTMWYQKTVNGNETVKQYSEPYYAHPTNVGKANERSNLEQAHFDFDSIVNKQRDKGYLEAGEIRNSKPMPMLAHKYTDHHSKVKYPAFVQPKLNGMRMLFNGTIGWSRGNKEVIPQVIQHLNISNFEYILDGELMLPNNVLLQETMSAIKKYRSGISEKLLYHVYDIVEPTMTYSQRLALLERLFADNKFPPNIILVSTSKANNKDEVNELHAKYVSKNYEGAMIRTDLTTYEVGKRSYSLLKLKNMVDAEYKIVDVIDGEGVDSGLAIFVLETNDGVRFNCRPEGTQDSRAELFKIRDTLVNKFLTVRYQELSKDGVPIFPVGVSIRELGEF